MTADPEVDWKELSERDAEVDGAAQPEQQMERSMMDHFELGVRVVCGLLRWLRDGAR